MKLRKYSIYKVKHLVEGSFLYMIYLGNNQFSRGKECVKENASFFKREVLKAKSNPLYVSSWLIPREFNSFPDKVDVLECLPFKSIKLVNNPEWMYATAVAKPKKDYSKMRILNRDA